MSSNVPKVKYTWHPIEPLSEADKNFDLTGITNLIDVWYEIKDRWQEENIVEFKNQLIRRLSIETGILEHLYDLNVGATQTLVTQGFSVELLRHSDSNLEAAALIQILKDHESAVLHVMDGIGDQRQLSISFVHELHQLLVQHQDKVEAVDQFGIKRKVPLLKGKFKQFPNNPTRQDQLLHEYSPPVQVATEMDNLLLWLGEYQLEQINPIFLAAWLHHRFTQIHPYQDGNGRLARTLMTHVLLKAQLLPVVIEGDRANRTQYIRALEAADYGNLEPLVQLIVRLEQKAILQALSFEISSEKPSTNQVFAALQAKLEKRRLDTQNQWRKVNDVAIAARVFAQVHLVKQLHLLRQLVPALDQSKHSDFIESASDIAHYRFWFRHGVHPVANQSDTFFNLRENAYFLETELSVEQEVLNFVIAWHHVGHELSGVIQTTAFAQFGSPKDSVPKNCATEPYIFTHLSDPTAINGQFALWLDQAFALAVQALTERL